MAPAAHDATSLSFVRAAGECADLFRAVDWGATPLGPPERWPASLRNMLGVLFSSRHPMFLWWGPELVQFYNDAYAPSLGAPGTGKHPRAMGQRGRECWPEIWPIIGPQIEGVMRDGTASWHEEQLLPIHRNGAIEDVYWTYGYSPVWAEDGSVGGTLVVCTEVTSSVLNRKGIERAHAEEEAARTRLHQLIRNAPVFVATLRGPAHVFQLTNGRYRSVVGASRELEGRPVGEALPEVVEQGFVGLLDAVFRTGEPHFADSVPVRLDRRGDGTLEEAFVSFVYQPYRDADGAVEGIDVFGYEVTDQVRARLVAQREGESSRVLAEAIPQQVWATTPVGKLELVNQRVLDYFPMTREELMAHGMRPCLHAEDAASVIAAWERSRAQGIPHDVEVRFRGRDGTYRWHLVRAVPLHDAEGKIVRWFGTNTDIDESRRLRDELLRRAEFEQHLLGIVSHDLRNPLNAISLGVASLAMHDELTPRAAKSAMRIQSAARRATRIVHDLLDLTRARLGGGLPVERAPVSLHDLASQVADELAVSHPEGLLEVRVNGDATGSLDGERIAQALGNLVANAFQYGEPGKVVTLAIDGDEKELSVQVHNEGAAIPPEALPTLFEPLKRAAAEVTNVSRSIGLGLFIVKEIVTGHGGRIEVRSAAGEGTTFVLRLPRH